MNYTFDPRSKRHKVKFYTSCNTLTELTQELNRRLDSNEPISSESEASESPVKVWSDLKKCAMVGLIMNSGQPHGDYGQTVEITFLRYVADATVEITFLRYVADASDVGIKLGW